jgi:hypothetical protein
MDDQTSYSAGNGVGRAPMARASVEDYGGAVWGVSLLPGVFAQR